jgi:hypothetical protein
MQLCALLAHAAGVVPLGFMLHLADLCTYIAHAPALPLRLPQQDGTDAAARRRRAELLGIAQNDDDAEVDDEAAAGTDRLARLDFQLNEQEDDLAAAEAAAAAELANREKQKRIQKLQLQASESQPVR